MNIGILTPGFSENSNDWALPFLQNLTSELAKRDSIRVIAMRYPHQREPYPVGDIQVYPLGYGSELRGLRRLILWWDTIRLIRQLHREKPFDILHAIWSDETGLVAMWAGRLLNIPVVTSIAGGELVCFPEINYGSQCSKLGRWIVRQAFTADAITVSGSHSRNLLHQAGYDVPDEKIHTLVWGVDTEKFHPPKSPKTSNRVLHVGSLVRIKNQELLLQTVAKLEDVELDIVGDGVLRSQLEALARDLGIQKRIHFHGNIPYSDMPTYFQNAKLHIITSQNEVVPMATLEAASCGIPSVSTAVGIITDYHGLGIAVDHHAHNLANAIKQLLEDENEYDALSKSAYETVQKHFTIQHTASRLRELYLSLQD